MKQDHRRARAGLGTAALVGTLLAIALPIELAAQTGGQAATALTIEEGIRRAEANNPAYRRTVNNLELTEIETRQFWLGLLPQPRISLLSTNMQWNRQAVANDIYGNPVDNPDFRMVQSASSSQDASLNFQLNFQDLYRRRAQRAAGEVRQVATEQGAQDLASDIRLDYLNAQEMLQALDLEAALLEVRRVNHQITEELFPLAQVDRAELLSSEIDLLDQEQQLEQSRADLEAALLTLRNRIGDPSLGEIAIEPAALRVFDPAGLDEEAIVRAAETDGPRVRQSELSLLQSEAQIGVQRALWLPTLSLSASTGRQQYSRESGSGFFQPLPDGEWSRRISLSLGFPDLGQFFNRQATGQQTAVNIRNAEESLRETRSAVEEEVRAVLLDLSGAYATILIQDRRAELANERLALEQERYRLGQGDYRDLQSSAESAAGAQRQAVQARYAFERALIRLERSTGTPIAVP